MKRLKAKPIAMFLVKDVRLLEHNPQAQYKFNRTWAIVWGLTLIAIPFIPTLYGHSISALIIQEISLWANFATHFGGMSAALAATETRETVEDIADVIVPSSDSPDQSLPA